MAAASYTTDLTTLDDGDALTNWAEPTASGWNVGDTYQADSGGENGFIQGTTAICGQMNKTGVCGILADNGSGTGGHGTDGAYLVWMTFTIPSVVDTYSAGGYRIMVGDGLGSFYSWDVGGIDVAPNPNGGWACYAVNTSESADDTLGGYTGGTEQYVGSAMNITAGISKGQPHCTDAIRYGRGELRVNGGDLSNGYATFADMAQENDYNDVTNGYNRWGLFTDISSGGGVYQMKGRMRLGYTSAVDMRDSNSTILIEDTPKCSTGFNYISVEQATSKVEWTNVTFISLGSQSPGKFELLADADIDFVGCNFVDMGAFIFDSVSSVTDTNFLRCGQITGAGATLTGCSVNSFSGAADSSALVWNVATNPDGYLDDMVFTMGAAATHAIEFGTSSPTTLTLEGITFTGYTNTIGSSAAPLYIARTTGDVTVTANGCSGITANGYKSAGANVTITTGTVTVLVHAIDANDFTDVVGARVLLYADTGGDLHSGASVTITSSGSTATVSHTGHGLASGTKVWIKGANQSEYNGVYAISNVLTDSYDYTITGTPASPATGTITSTYVILDDTTDANGEVKDTAFVYTSAQPVLGNVRRGTTTTRYKPAPATGSVGASGFSYTAVMIPDE